MKLNHLIDNTACVWILLHVDGHVFSHAGHGSLSVGKGRVNQLRRADVAGATKCGL